MSVEIDLGESGDARVVPDNPPNDFDVTAEDGQVIRHRMVYVRDRPYQATDEDLRIHALQQANQAFASSSALRYPVKDAGGDEPEEQIVAEAIVHIAQEFAAFLRGE